MGDNGEIGKTIPDTWEDALDRFKELGQNYWRRSLRKQGFERTQYPTPFQKMGQMGPHKRRICLDQGSKKALQGDVSIISSFLQRM